MDEAISTVLSTDPTYIKVYIALLRYTIPVLSFFLLVHCGRTMVFFRREPEIWAWLCLENGKKIPVTHWENMIGRHKKSDIVLNKPTVSRNHAVLTRYDDGSWSIADAGSSGGIAVNGRNTDVSEVLPGDEISVGGIRMTLQPISEKQEKRLAEIRTRGGTVGGSLLSCIILTAIQLSMCMGFLFSGREGSAGSVVLGFGAIMAAQWLLLLFYFTIRKTSFDIEAIAFYLCTLGMAVICTVAPKEAGKQLIAMAVGLAGFLGIGWSLRDLQRAKVLRYVAAVAGIGFLLITLVFGKEYYGAKNWVVIGSFSFQLSELSKLCFVFVGASALDKLVLKKNLMLFIIYSAVLCGCLALMNDFGTAIVFFCAFLMISYMRSGSVGTVALAITAVAFAGVLTLKIAPHALSRFSNWRHIWDDPYGAGYQQTKALMCLASGGIFGLGAGKGKLAPVFAADSDIVFATVSEEWGLLIALAAVLCIVLLAVFCVRSAAVSRSSFFTIASCTSACMMVIQVFLNVLGTLDVVPLTGITFPFLSNGGSSMICAWGLLAFVKACDTRQDASFAVRIVKGEPERE